MSDPQMVEFLLDQLDDPAVTARSMFGGHGVYRDGKMFAIVYEDEVYMKVSKEEAEVSDRQPFRPRPKQTLRSYRLVAADELEDRQRLVSLAHKAQTVP